MGDIDFKVISATENSNKFPKKTRFWKEKSVEDVVTLGPKAQATIVCFLKLNNVFGLDNKALYLFPCACDKVLGFRYHHFHKKSLTDISIGC